MLVSLRKTCTLVRVNCSVGRMVDRPGWAFNGGIVGVRWMLRLVLAMLLLNGAAVASDEPTSSSFNAEGYRIELMRSPVTLDVLGAATIDDPQQLVQMLDSERPPLLIDVLPLLWRGIFVEAESHLNIPGSYWVPNVGRGELEEMWQVYLEESLQSLTLSDSEQPLVFYCKADCWHSWNAAKRAVSLGYQQVYWYPLGIEGWLELGLELEPSHPQKIRKDD